MCRGELKTLYDDRISAGWLFHFIGEPMDLDRLKRYIRNMAVNESRHRDGEIPRTSAWHMHEIRIDANDRKVIDVTLDPYIQVETVN